MRSSKDKRGRVRFAKSSFDSVSDTKFFSFFRLYWCRMAFFQLSPVKQVELNDGAKGPRQDPGQVSCTHWNQLPWPAFPHTTHHRGATNGHFYWAWAIQLFGYRWQMLLFCIQSIRISPPPESPLVKPKENGYWWRHCGVWKRRTSFSQNHTFGQVKITSICPPPSNILVKCVTDSIINALAWDHYVDPQGRIRIISYSTGCWADGGEETILIQRTTKDTEVTIEPLLDRDTLYHIEVKAVYTDASGSTFDGPAGPVLTK